MFLGYSNEKPIGFILQKVEESYTILWQRLAGSALTDNHSGMWKCKFQTLESFSLNKCSRWNYILFCKAEALWDSLFIFKKLFAHISNQAEIAICWVSSLFSKRNCSGQLPCHPFSLSSSPLQSRRQSGGKPDNPKSPMRLVGSAITP